MGSLYQRADSYIFSDSDYITSDYTDEDEELDVSFLEPSVQKYILDQEKYGFIYDWIASNDMSTLGVFKPIYGGGLNTEELEELIRHNPEIGQSIIVRKDNSVIFEPFGGSLLIRDRFKLISELGRGAFGRTYLAQDKDTDRYVALKLIDLDRLKLLGYSFSLIKNEIKNLQDLSGSEYIVQYYESFEDFYEGVHTMFIVSEYLVGKTLAQFILEKRILEPNILWPLFLQLILGLKYMHDQGYVHRDIKPDNIMITQDNRIKYIDFGLSCVEKCRIDSCQNTCKSPHGTIKYLPPEFLNKSRYPVPLTLENYKLHDIWSLGLTLFQMANFGNLPDIFPIQSQYTQDDGRTNKFLEGILIEDWKHRPNIHQCFNLLIHQILENIW